MMQNIRFLSSREAQRDKRLNTRKKSHACELSYRRNSKLLFQKSASASSQVIMGRDTKEFWEDLISSRILYLRTLDKTPIFPIARTSYCAAILRSNHLVTDPFASRAQFVSLQLAALLPQVVSGALPMAEFPT